MKHKVIVGAHWKNIWIATTYSKSKEPLSLTLSLGYPKSVQQFLVNCPLKGVYFWIEQTFFFLGVNVDASHSEQQKPWIFGATLGRIPWSKSRILGCNDPGSPWPPFFIGWFPNHHYFSRSLSSSKKEPPFLKWWLTSRDEWSNRWGNPSIHQSCPTLHFGNWQFMLFF